MKARLYLPQDGILPRWNRILPFLILLHRLVQNLDHKAPHQSQSPSVQTPSALFLSVSFIPWGGGWCSFQLGSLSWSLAESTPKGAPTSCCIGKKGKESLNYRKQENLVVRGVSRCPPSSGPGSTNSSLSHSLSLHQQFSTFIATEHSLQHLVKL